MKLGEIIKSYRKRNNLTLQQLADKIGVTNMTISHYEQGTRKPKKEYLLKIAEVLRVSPYALHEFNVEDAREAIEFLFRLEDYYAIVPAIVNDKCVLVIDDSEDKNLELCTMIKEWAKEKKLLDNSEITLDEYNHWKNTLS